MKGMVFTEFLDMVEQTFGDEMLDDIIEDANLDNNGAYTAVGTYDHQELVKLVIALSEHSQIAIPDLLATYGKHLFGRFANLYPNFFEGVTNTFDFLKNIDQYIHIEVKKLYPEAELPKFDYEEIDGKTLKLIYSSPRHFSDFARGLILGCLDYYQQQATIDTEDLSTEQDAKVIFTITMQ